MPYVGVWLLIVLIVLVASVVARWLDGALQMQMIRQQHAGLRARQRGDRGPARRRDAALFLRAGAVAGAPGGGDAGAGRGAAGAHPSALPVQQHEHRGRADPGRPGRGRAHGGGSFRTVPRRAGPARQQRRHAGRGAGPGRALSGDRAAAPGRPPACATRAGRPARRLPAAAPAAAAAGGERGASRHPAVARRRRGDCCAASATAAASASRSAIRCRPRRRRPAMVMAWTACANAWPIVTARSAKVQAGPQGDRFVVLLHLPGGSA